MVELEEERANAQIARLIYELLEKAGLTQKELAFDVFAILVLSTRRCR